MKKGDLVTVNFRFSASGWTPQNQYLENRIFVITHVTQYQLFTLEPVDGRRQYEFIEYEFLSQYIDLLPEQELCQSLNDVGLL